MHKIRTQYPCHIRICPHVTSIWLIAQSHMNVEPAGAQHRRTPPLTQEGLSRGKG
jgi:hypothetical protein